jgi:hypothetical protein
MIDHKTLRLSAVLLVVGFILLRWWASSIPTGQAHSGPRPATEHPSMTPTDPLHAQSAGPSLRTVITCLVRVDELSLRRETY